MGHKDKREGLIRKSKGGKKRVDSTTDKKNLLDLYDIPNYRVQRH